jgi:hypothetical protein
MRQSIMAEECSSHWGSWWRGGRERKREGGRERRRRGRKGEREREGGWERVTAYVVGALLFPFYSIQAPSLRG